MARRRLRVSGPIRFGRDAAGRCLLPSRAALPVARPPPLGSRRLLTRAMVTTVPPGAGYHSPATPAPSRPAPLAFLASSGARRSPSAAPCASWVCSASSHWRRVQRRTAAPRPLAPKPLEKRRRPVRFAPIWLTSVHYSDHSRHAARSRAQRPRSTALGCHTARRTTRRRSSAAGNAIAPARPPGGVPSGPAPAGRRRPSGSPPPRR